MIYTGRENRTYHGRRKPSTIWLIGGGGCFLLLGLVLLLVPGVRFSGQFFLALAGCCLMGLLVNRWAEISFWGRCCKWIFLFGLTAVLVLVLALETLVLRESGGGPADKPVSAVIVLGAGVNGEKPSMSLMSRIDAASEYLENHPDLPAVLSGGKGRGERISEAEAMRRELTARGIDRDRLWLEERSSNTAENFRFSLETLADHGMDATDTVAVVTNDFHLFRAKLIARRAGMAEPVGIPAELPWWLAGNYYVREAFASVKTLVFD